jgi:hypothetical protein
MARRRSSVPKQKPLPLLYIATHLPDDPQDLLTHCTASCTAVQKEPALANVVPAASVMNADTAALNVALVAAEGGGPIPTSAVETAVASLKQDYQLLAKSVQGILRSGPIEAVPGILSAILMYQSNVGKRKPKAPFEVVQPTTWPSGSVHAIALAVPSAQTYGWEFSVDQKSWTVVTTAQSDAVLTGFTPGTMYYFRFRCFLRNNTETAYSVTFPFMVR